MATDARTTSRNYPKPHPDNLVSEDIARLILALEAIDVDVAGLLTAVAGRALASHAHTIANVTGLQTALDEKKASSWFPSLDELTDVSVSGAADGQFLRLVSGSWQGATISVAWGDVSGKPSSFPTTWSDVSGKPTTFTPSTHSHDTSAVTGLDATLAALAGGISSNTSAISAKAAKAGDNMTGNHYWSNNYGTFYRNAAGSFTPGSAGAGLFKGADDTVYFDNYEGAFVFRLASYAEALSIAPGGDIRVGGGGAAEAKFDVNGNAITRGDHRLKAASYPKVLFEATGNPSGSRKVQIYYGPTGILRFGHLNDAENAETPGTISFDGALQVGGSTGSAAHVLAGGAAVAWVSVGSLMALLNAGDLGDIVTAADVTGARNFGDLQSGANLRASSSVNNLGATLSGTLICLGQTTGANQSVGWRKVAL